MKIKLDHINLTVQNIQESITWYSKIFGFELVEKGIGKDGEPWAIVNSDDSMIAMGEVKGKLSPQISDDSQFHKIYHFGIRVSNSSQWEKIVSENNLRIFYGGVVDYPHSKSWYIHDPSGHTIEVSCTEGEKLKFEK